jgi:hypothetical protein
MLSRLLETPKIIANSALLLIVLLATGCASTSEKEIRFYELEGARNFRDFGGYETDDGSQVVWGKLFRSNQPAGMTTADYSRVASLKLATVVDFRTAEERETEPTNWQADAAPKFVLLPMGSTEAFRELDALVEAAIEAEDTDALRELGAEVYRRMPVEYADEFGQLLRSLASEQSLPTMIHCHAGLVLLPLTASSVVRDNSDRRLRFRSILSDEIPISSTIAFVANCVSPSRSAVISFS